MPKCKLGPDHHRYVDELDPGGLVVTCKKYVVMGKTDRYWYIVDEFHNGLFEGSQRESLLKQCRKSILKDGGEHGRRFAYTDKALALSSYKHRTPWQVRHAQLSLERTKAAIGISGIPRSRAALLLTAWLFCANTSRT